MPRPVGPVDGRVAQLPGPVNEQLSPLALEVTADAVSDYDRALALQNWFRSEFTYSLDTAAGNDTEALTTFLQDRSGYCEQFAATMALMARTLGIPSRVQVGFTPGPRPRTAPGSSPCTTPTPGPSCGSRASAGSGSSRRPAAATVAARRRTRRPLSTPGARVEALVTDNEGRGVVLRRGGCQDIETAPTTAVCSGAAEPGPLGGSHRRHRHRRRPTRARQPAGGSSARCCSGPQRALAAPYTARRVRRARRRRTVVDAPTAVAAAWADILDSATDVDLEPTATETPRDLAHRIPRRGGLMRGQAAQMEQLAGWIERTRYGAPGELQLPTGRADLGDGP